MIRLAFAIILTLPVFFTVRYVSAESPPVRDVVAYRQAAEAGNPDAQYSLGVMYQFGMGTKQNLPAALQWYRKAVEQNDARSQYALGLMYYTGNGVKQDVAEAVKLYKLAAEQGHTEAQRSLGIVFANGAEFIEQDDNAALQWFTKAAEQGDAEAQYRLGTLYKVTKSGFRNAHKAAEWFTKAAEQQHIQAIYALGKCYKTGYGVSQDNGQAAQLYEQAAALGDVYSQFALSQIYYNTPGYEMAGVPLLMQAAKQGLIEAEYMLSKTFFEGVLVKQDHAEALYWIEQSFMHPLSDQKFVTKVRPLHLQILDTISKQDYRRFQMLSFNREDVPPLTEKR